MCRNTIFERGRDMGDVRRRACAALAIALTIGLVPAAATQAAAPKVKITWNANGGKIGGVKTKAVKVKKGAKIGKLPTAKRAGYTFKGWWTKKTDGKKVTTKTKATKKATYWAHWAKKGSSKTDKSVMYKAGETVSGTCSSGMPFILMSGSSVIGLTLRPPITCTGAFKGTYTLSDSSLGCTPVKSGPMKCDGGLTVTSPNFTVKYIVPGMPQYGSTVEFDNTDFEATFVTKSDLMKP